MLNYLKVISANIVGLLWLPHAVVYRLSSDRVRDEISRDVSVNSPAAEPTAVHGHAGVMAVARAIGNNRYLRTLFFHRIKHLKIRKFLWGGYSSGLEIPYDVTIGAGVRLDHPFSTIINAKSIGKNFRVKNNITVGNKNDDENLRPVIGDNVFIGAGAVVIGDITVGDNVTIGAGAVVVKSLPDNCVAVGNPARIINK